MPFLRFAIYFAGTAALNMCGRIRTAPDFNARR
jgi:hypothetical protein